MASKDCYESSSEEIRVNCSVCTEENKDVSAEKYCVECNDYYCSSCVTIHTTVPALRSHTLLDKEAGQDGKLPLVPTERCEKHLFKPVDMFCENHDEIGCYTCMAVEHRLCQDVFYIPDLMKTRANDVTGFLDCFADIEKRLQLFKERFLSKKDTLQKSKEQELEKIREFSSQLEKKIKEAEQLASREVETCFKEIDDDLQTNIESVNSELETIEKKKRHVESTIQNSSQAFVLMKKNQQSLTNAKKSCEALSKVKKDHILKFKRNRYLDTILTDQICLGNIAKDLLLYKFSSKGSIDIKGGTVSKPSDILGSCVLHDGSVVLANGNNRKLQRIDIKTMTVSDQYTFDSLLWGVCCLNKKEIAACLPAEKRVQIFYSEGKFTPLRSFTVEFGCQSISFFENTFYIADNSFVYVCNPEGNILKAFRGDSIGKALFSSIFSLCVSSDGKLIYVCDFSNGVITLRDDGNVVNIVSTEITYPNGVTTDDMGNVFVCGYGSKNLIQLDKCGTYLGTVMKNRSLGPQSICFDSKLNRLYVPNHNACTVDFLEAE